MTDRSSLFAPLVPRALVFALAGTLLPTLAFAEAPATQKPKFQKKESEVQAAAQTELTKPAQKPKDEKKKPTIDVSDVFSGKGEDLKTVTDAQVKVITRLIDNTSDDDAEKPDLLFRRAELYAENEHYYNFKAREMDEKVFGALEQGDKAKGDKLRAQQKDYEKRQKDWLFAAVKEYKTIIDNPKFEKYKRMDQVLFYLAFLLTQQKREDLARPIFKRLIKDFPQSPYIPDAYLAFGEYFFEQKDMDSALKFYNKVLEFPESRVYGYAHYKEGWVYLNLQDYKQALKVFVDVIKESKGGKDKSKIQLLKEAKKDAVRAYAYVGTCDKAWDFFTKIGDEYAPTMLEQLGELYNSMGNFEQSICTYRTLIKLQPESVKLCNWQTEVLRNTLSKTGSRATEESVKELQRLSAIWEKYQTMKDAKKEQIDECRDNTAGSLRELATTWHKEAQKTNQKPTYDLAQYLYKEYIKGFPKEKDIYPMTFFYGELLFKLEKFCDAAPVYTDVVKLDATDKAKYRNDAAYAAVISYKNCLAIDEEARPITREQQQKADKDVKKDEKQAKAPKGKKGKGDKVEKAADDKKTEQVAAYTPREIPEKQRQMIEAFDTYIQYVPKSNELGRIRYNKARIYYENDHIPEAAKFFREVVDNHRDDEVAPYALNLLFDCQAILVDFDGPDGLEANVAKYCPWPELSRDPEVTKQCANLKTNIKRTKIEAAEKGGRYRVAADGFMDLAKENPADPKLDEILHNAAENYIKAKAFGQAIAARAVLIEKRPDSPLSKKALFRLGQSYADIAAYGTAAENFEKFAVKYPGEKAPYDASTALFTAAFYRRGLGEIDKSIEDTTKFIDIYGKRPEYVDKSAGVFFSLLSIYEEQKDNAKIKKHLQDYLKSWGPVGGVDREIMANVKLGELAWKDSCPVPGVNGACVTVERVRATAATAKTEKAKKGNKKVKKKGFVMPAQCGPPTKTKVILHERKPLLVKEALGYFAKALALYANGAAVKKVPGEDEQKKQARTIDMIYHVAQARMMQGDEQYEKLIAIKMPEKLDFTPPDPYSSKARQAKDKKRLEDSQKSFTSYIDAKTKQLAAVQGIYQNVLQYKAAHWSIAAVARLGQIFQDFSGQLFTAPIPKPPKPPEGGGITEDEFNQTFYDTYCDTLADKAEPLEVKAIEGLSTCLGKSTELSWFNEWSALCEAELNQIKPAEYPLASEVRAQPGYADRRSDPAPIVTELK